MYYERKWRDLFYGMIKLLVEEHERFERLLDAQHEEIQRLNIMLALKENTTKEDRNNGND